MRSWHLLLLVTVGVSLLLILREAPTALPSSPDVGRTVVRPPILLEGGGSFGLTRNATTTAVVSSPAAGRAYALPRAAAAATTPPPPPPYEELARYATDQHARWRTSVQKMGGNISDAAAAVKTVVASTGGVLWQGPGAPFIVLGVVSNVMWANSFERRRFIRESWKTYTNVGKTMHVVFIVALRQSDLSPVPQEVESRLRAEAAKHGDMLLFEQVPERKSPCLKTMAWFRHAVHTYPGATFIAKTDDDAFVQTIKLEANMRPFANKPQVYIGSTLWGSYITKTFEACARRMGPNMCAGGMKEERCAERGAIGPYPYAVGMLQVLSYDIASWMVQQDTFAEFERRATAATRPPMMDHGEDMVIGMFLYLSPWPLMPLHWGWDKLHDLCFKCTRKDQIWRPITTQTVVAHHTANEDIMREVFHNVTYGSHFDPRPCDDKCQHQLLPFEVTSLKDLCSRGGGSIRRVYSKCAMLD
jgi:hypothetical protein